MEQEPKRPRALVASAASSVPVTPGRRLWSHVPSAHNSAVPDIWRPRERGGRPQRPPRPQAHWLHFPQGAFPWPQTQPPQEFSGQKTPVSNLSPPRPQASQRLPINQWLCLTRADSLSGATVSSPPTLTTGVLFGMRTGKLVPTHTEPTASAFPGPGSDHCPTSPGRVLRSTCWCSSKGAEGKSQRETGEKPLGFSHP